MTSEVEEQCICTVYGPIYGLLYYEPLYGLSYVPI